MSCSNDFLDYVCEQVRSAGAVRSRRMFGDAMVYINDKPILLVCDNLVFVKKLDCVQELLKNAVSGVPYDGAKEHWILDIDDAELSTAVVKKLETVTKVPKKRSKKK